MEKTATVNVRVNPEVKRSAEEILESLGLSMSTAIEVFLRQVALTKGIPFSISIPKNESFAAEGAASTDSRDSARATSRDDVLNAIAEAARAFPQIRKAYLFGSFARGDARASSDVDVRIVLDESMAFTLRDLNQFAKRVEQLTGRNADVVSAKTIANDALARAIEQDKVIAYER